MGNKGWDAALSAVDMASLKGAGRQSPVASRKAFSIQHSAIRQSNSRPPGARDKKRKARKSG
jgi:hypothetical protein